MKNASKEILAAAIGIAAGSALGVLMAEHNERPGKHRTGESPCRSRRRKRLLFAKNKLELHRERLNHHLSRINSKIESLSPANPANQGI